MTNATCGLIVRRPRRTASWTLAALFLSSPGPWAPGIAGAGPAALQPDPPIPCERCDVWNARQAPFRVFGNTWYVGTAGLSAILITSESGHVLLDGALPQSAPLIEENIRALGFRLDQVKLILNSHAHYDHAGGLAALARASGAAVAASPAGARSLQQGEPVAEDPQHAFGRAANAFPSIPEVRVVADGETLRAGDVAITARFTPGHTPGATTWTWRSCEGPRCLDVVYADSLNAVSAPGFRFTAVPGVAEAFAGSIERVASLPCDILLTVHPEFSDILGKLARRAAAEEGNPFIDRQACRAYAAGAQRSLGERIGRERAEPKAP